jgi:chromosome segregation ATPase
MNSYTAHYYSAREALPGGPQTDRELQLVEKLAEARARAEVAELEKDEAEEKLGPLEALKENTENERDAAENRAAKAEQDLQELRDASGPGVTGLLDKLAELGGRVAVLQANLNDCEKHRLGAIERMAFAEDESRRWREEAKRWIGDDPTAAVTAAYWHGEAIKAQATIVALRAELDAKAKRSTKKAGVTP